MQPAGNIQQLLLPPPCVQLDAGGWARSGCCAQQEVQADPSHRQGRVNGSMGGWVGGRLPPQHGHPHQQPCHSTARRPADAACRAALVPNRQAECKHAPLCTMIHCLPECPAIGAPLPAGLLDCQAKRGHHAGAAGAEADDPLLPRAKLLRGGCVFRLAQDGSTNVSQ